MPLPFFFCDLVRAILPCALFAMQRAPEFFRSVGRADRLWPSDPRRLICPTFLSLFPRTASTRLRFDPSSFRRRRNPGEPQTVSYATRDGGDAFQFQGRQNAYRASYRAARPVDLSRTRNCPAARGREEQQGSRVVAQHQRQDGRNAPRQHHTQAAVAHRQRTVGTYFEQVPKTVIEKIL